MLWLRRPSLRLHHQPPPSLPFSYRNPSFIVRPSVGSKAISCMFAGDGSTMARACVPPGKNKTCTPGCFVKGACQNRWISGDASKWMHGENCFDREHLELAMATHEQTTKYSTLDWCHVPPENTAASTTSSCSTRRRGWTIFRKLLKRSSTTCWLQRASRSGRSTCTPPSSERIASMRRTCHSYGSTSNVTSTRMRSSTM